MPKPKLKRPVILLPKILNPTGTDADKSSGVLHVDQKYAQILDLGSEVDYTQSRKFAFTHPDSKYHLIMLDKSRPSTCFPLIEQKLAKMAFGIIPDISKEPSIVEIKKPGTVGYDSTDADDE